MNPSSASAPMLAGITGQRILTPSGPGVASLRFHAGLIDDAGGHARRSGQWLDAGNLLVLPGIVDLHGDAFERAVMPRPGVAFPYGNALHDVDRQLLANGITTEFHGVTLSWEGGLRGEPYAERMFDTLDALRDELAARHYVHLRFETHHLDGVAIAQDWIRAGRVRFLALNDHLPGMARRLGDDRKLLQYADRAECDLDTFRDRIRQAMSGADRVASAMRDLVRSAHEAGLKVASHDDPDASTRRYYHGLGCEVAEFPLTPEAARVARDLGNAVVFGAPNVVRGGSHTGAPGATEMVRTGLCDVLTSDYYYPAPLLAALQLAQTGVLPLEEAWALVSANPARAAGLRDRGSLAPGRIADLIVVDDSVPGMPRVCAAVVGGVLRYASRQFEGERAAALAA
ncbi:alpha-D-ribose 1-methylphosphonate 5-triphosphate diphosphatase [Bordetella genomosp. 1]|uniref:Alpha-D-ribose 1-methylphosphonate 5-triphosphate diphosphatase n=1 Tax=Bordetella genomosp. 1 TaxID=1395607 RepID=A0ABX4F672_9BORD|nr:alpha-D-ribose 1-methylphosphonate 5-triphosphate diphosphatase [Bordetella genomosp. 1]OZI69262.1 alpha-D-ribose 1-methylphosphonate 5-triphosphate diphosphatase [Bordetella genomosp. 1]